MPKPNQNHTHRRVCVMRAGYAVVPGTTDEEALENAKKLKADDFEWEPVTPELVETDAEVVEACDEHGGV